MKDLSQILVSFYQNVYSKTPEVVSLLTVLESCLKSTYASLIGTIRRYFADGDIEAAQNIKRRLPVFTPAGTFDGAHCIKNFQMPSNVIGLDFDHVANRLEILHICAQDPHTLAVLESPTDGLKVFAYAENIKGRHQEAHQLVARYYEQLLGLESDPACKDISRLCYVTYSSNGYIATIFESFLLPDEEQPSDKEKDERAVEGPTADEENQKEVQPTFPVQPDMHSLQGFLSSYIFSNPLTPSQRHSNLFKLACEACRRGYLEKDVLREVSVLLSASGFPPEEMKSTLSSGYKIVMESNDVNSHHPSPAGGPLKTTQTTKTTKPPYRTPENDINESEAYWEGEELRKKTPCFEKKVYENLPDQINQCILANEELTQREEDLSLLASFTAFSAAMPCTFGLYNHKHFSPHIFSFIIAPAGSGKSIIQLARYLLEDLQEHILAQSKKVKKEYERNLQKLKDSYRRKKNSEDTSDEKELEEPPFKTLIIPATTSYTRLQKQIQDNGSMGSIIIDTEAQTIAHANKQDCGGFDDIIRKAFEHEVIESSYKTNGVIPIYIRHPRLAWLISGTPGQANHFINSPESGLFSRVTFYTFREESHWKTMGESHMSYEEYFAPLAKEVTALFEFCMAHPVHFHFTRAQWNQLNDVFSHLLSDVALDGNDDLQAVVKRHAFLVMRLSMIQARLRQFAAQDTSTDIYCLDQDFERSLSMILCCYQHSRLLLLSLPGEQPPALKNPNSIYNFINDLPDVFTTAEAIQVAQMHQLGKRKVERLLKSLTGLKINKLSHGNYKKI